MWSDCFTWTTIVVDEYLLNIYLHNNWGDRDSDAYRFAVSENPAGSGGGPSEPAGLTAPIVSLDFLTLSWRQPEDPGLSDILGYMIQWNEAGSVRYLVLEECIRLFLC